MDYVCFHGTSARLPVPSFPHPAQPDELHPPSPSITLRLRTRKYDKYKILTLPSHKNIAAKPPATAAKLKVMVAPAALDTVAGDEPVAVLEPLVMLPEPVAVAVELEPDDVLLPGSGMVLLYDEQVEFGARGQVSSSQMLWS
jgi:hypothetical protein